MATMMDGQTANISQSTIGVGRRARAAGIAGVASIALGVGGVLIDEMWRFPSTGATGAQIAAFVAAHRSALFVAMVLTASAVGLWLVFGAGVWERMRAQAGREEDMLATCFGVGFVSFATLLFAGFAAFFVLIYRAPAPSDPRLLYDIAFGMLAISGVPTAVALGAYAAHVYSGSIGIVGGSAGISRSPRWTGLLAVVGAVAHVLLLASLVIRGGFFSLAGGVTIAIPGTLFAWIAGTSAEILLPVGTSSRAISSSANVTASGGRRTKGAGRAL